MQCAHRPSGDYGNTFMSFKGPAGGDGGEDDVFANPSGGEPDVEDGKDLNLTVDDSLFTQEDILEDNDGEDIFGEDSQDIDTMFGFPGDDTSANDFDDDAHIYQVASGGRRQSACAVNPFEVSAAVKKDVPAYEEPAAQSAGGAGASNEYADDGGCLPPFHRGTCRALFPCVDLPSQKNGGKLFI